MRIRLFNSLFMHLFLVILLATLPAFVMIYKVEVRTKQEVMARDRIIATHVLQGLGFGETLIISMTRDMLQNFADIPEIRNLDITAIKKRLKLPDENFFHIKALLVFDKNANLLGHIGDLPPSYPADKKEVLDVLKQNSFAVGAGKPDDAEGFFILPCYQPVYSKDGSVKGVLCVLLDTEQHYNALTEELVEEFEVSSRWRLAISDKDGRLLYVFPKEEKKKLTGKMGSLFAPVIAGVKKDKTDLGTYRMEIDQAGDVRIGNYFSLRLTEQSPVYGYVFIGTSEAAVLNEILQQWRDSVLHYLFFVIMVFIATLFLAQRLFEKPLLQITDAARRFKSGDHKARSCVMTAQNEIVELSKAFDDMAKTVELQDEERARIMRELEEQASTDALTGVFNRRAADAITTQSLFAALRHKNPLSLCFVDLDGFKEINDLYGHAEGDRVLIFIASLMKKYIRLSDSLCRMGGDEFLLILPECNEENAVMMWNRIQAAMDAVNQDTVFAFDLKMSHGIATFDPEHPIDLEELIALADERMYADKKQRKEAADALLQKEESD